MSAQFAHFTEELQNTFINQLTDLTNKNKSLNERIYNVLSEEGELPILYSIYYILQSNSVTTNSVTTNSRLQRTKKGLGLV